MINCAAAASPIAQPCAQAEWMPPAVTGDTMPAASPVRITPGAATLLTGPPHGISPARTALRPWAGRPTMSRMRDTNASIPGGRVAAPR